MELSEVKKNLNREVLYANGKANTGQSRPIPRYTEQAHFR